MDPIVSSDVIGKKIGAIRNHETDYGVTHLLFLEKCARFPIINANLFIKSNYSRLFKPHVVLEINGMKVLFIGIIMISIYYTSVINKIKTIIHISPLHCSNW